MSPTDYPSQHRHHRVPQDDEADDLLNERFFSRLVDLLAGSDVHLLLAVLETLYQVRAQCIFAQAGRNGGRRSLPTYMPESYLTRVASTALFGLEPACRWVCLSCTAPF